MSIEPHLEDLYVNPPKIKKETATTATDAAKKKNTKASHFVASKQCPFKCGETLFRSKGELKSHLLLDCPDQKLKCRDCSRQVSKASKAHHFCVETHNRLMEANAKIFKP